MKDTLTFTASPGGSLKGTIKVPGDKSVSHRSIMLAALAEGETRIEGFLEGEDSLNTLAAFRAMGVEVSDPLAGQFVVKGVGLRGLKKPPGPLYLGNSGTSMRLLSGLLAGQHFDTLLEGDSSLSRRPMRRMSEPLNRMGARIETADNGCPPLVIHGGQQLRGIDYAVPVASAQVKSGLLLAALYAEGETCVTEPVQTRDHTERMLESFAYPLIVRGNTVSIEGGGVLKATNVQVPADISSAAFFMVGASLAETAEVVLESVGINPARTGVIEILKLMGANIEIFNERNFGAEPVADIKICSAQLKGIDIPEKYVASAIDEFPILFVAAACASGTTRLTGASELRVKESDRIQSMAEGLCSLGVDATPTQDGMIIQGRSEKLAFEGGVVDSHGDHRIAMAFSIAALRSRSAIQIKDCANVNTSFPGFVTLAVRLGMNIRHG